jgi:alpha-glucoside transport system permease protein
MLEAFRNNLLWLVFGTIFSVGIGLLIAVLADRSRYESVYKAIIFMPMAISFVGAGVIWKFIYSYTGTGSGIQEIGLLNAIVIALGGKAQAWLQISPWNNFLLIIIMVWLQTGYAMVILSAAIKGVPAELMEAARIDGATEIQAFFRIIIPQIQGTLITVATTILIFALKLFDIVSVMTGGNYGTNVIAYEFYITRFTFGDAGRASAIAIVLLVAVIPVMIYNLRQFRESKAF